MAKEPGGELWGIGTGHGGAPVPSPLGLPNGGAMIARQLVIYPPEIYPIPDAIEFNLEGDVATVIVQAGITIPNVTVQLGAGYIGIIRGFSIYIDDMLATTDVRWTLLLNGQPAPGYGNLRMFPRVAPSVSNGFDAFVRVPDGNLITVVFSNVDGGTYRVGAAISGWMWPKSSGERWIASGY